MYAVVFEERDIWFRRRALDFLKPERNQALLQQSINRAGKEQVSRIAREVRQLLPVKLKYVRQRIKFRQADRTGTQARIRIYGAGKDASAFIRPRHMKLRVAVREATRRKKAAKSPVSFGVGGARPEAAKQSVPRGWVASVGSGRSFHPFGSSTYDSARAQVWQRAGRGRYPFTQVRGVTVGQVASDAGLIDDLGEQWMRSAQEEYLRRLEVVRSRRGQ